MSTGFATLASAGRSSREALERRLAELGQLEPGRVARVGAEDPEAAGVREHGDPPALSAPAGSRAAPRRRSAPPARPRGSRPPGGRARRRPPRSRRARPCASWRRAARVAVVAALEREDRLAAGDAPREPAEAARVAERLDVEQHDARSPSSSSHHSSRSFDETSALFPIETNAERPSPRDSAASSSASPSAPLCDEKPMLPLGAERAAKVAFRRGAGDGDAEAVRADQPRPVRANEREQPLLPLDALAADLGEAGRDDDERAHAARAARPPPRRARARRAREITARSTGSRDLGDGAVAADARDRLALAVDRIRGAAEVAREHVAEELAADRAAPRRGARSPPRSRGSKNGRSEARTADVVALLDAALVALRRGERELAPRPRRSSSSRVSSNPAPRRRRASPRFSRQHLGDEPLDAGRGRARASCSSSRVPMPRPWWASATAKAASATRRVAQTHVVRERHDPLAPVVGRERAERARRARPSRARAATRRAVGGGAAAVEAKVEALLRERAEEVEQRSPRPRAAAGGGEGCRRPAG